MNAYWLRISKQSNLILQVSHWSVSWRTARLYWSMSDIKQLKINEGSFSLDFSAKVTGMKMLMLLANLADVVVGLECLWWHWWVPWVVYLQGAMPIWVSNFERKGRPKPPKIAQPCHMIAGRNQYHKPASTRPDPKAWNFASENLSKKPLVVFPRISENPFFVIELEVGATSGLLAGRAALAARYRGEVGWKKQRTFLKPNFSEKIESNQKVHLTENLGIKKCRGNETFQLCVACLESILEYQIESLSHAAMVTVLLLRSRWLPYLPESEVVKDTETRCCERCVCWTWGTNGYRLGKHEAGEIANVSCCLTLLYCFYLCVL